MSQPLGGNMSKRRRTEEKKIDMGVVWRGEQRGCEPLRDSEGGLDP